MNAKVSQQTPNSYLISWPPLLSGYNLPRFWEVTWVHTFSPALGRNITEVEPTNLRQDQVYIEVGYNQGGGVKFQQIPLKIISWLCKRQIL